MTTFSASTSNACDCHHHLYDSTRFPPTLSGGIFPLTGAWKTPPPYIGDNRVTLDAIARSGPVLEVLRYSAPTCGYMDREPNVVPKAEIVTTRTRAGVLYVGFALFATWIVWGSTYLAIKIALPVFPPFLQMGSRFLAAGLLLLLIGLARGARPPSFHEWRSASVVGTLLLGGGAGGTAFAEKTVASGLAASFVAFEPALILLMSLAFSIKPTRHEIIGIALGLLGVVLLIRGDGFSASPAGVIAMTVATVSWSAGSVLAINALRCAPGSVGAASQMICGAVFLLILSRVEHEHVRWPALPGAVAAWLYLVLFGSMLAFTAFTYLLTNVRTSVAMSYTFVNPIVALVLGSLLGAEHFTLSELFATAIIAIGVLLLLRDREHIKTVGRASANSTTASN